MEIKVFNDLVHGHMIFHPLIVVVADTRQLQRLRNIKQLGGCYFIYSTASHNRFEHCLGTAYVAGQLLDNLKKKRTFHSKAEEDAWEKKKLCIQIAGLCHDVGHGPFSHTWEKFRQKVDPNEKWSHEFESVKMLDEIFQEKISPRKKFEGKRLETVRDAFEFYGLNSSDLEFVKKVILGNKNTRNYLYQIINNKNNDIDVDKWDYLARDSAMLNIPVGFDYKRLINFCRVLKNDDGVEEIGFREKECSLLVEMFLARGRLHDKAYQHVKVKIVEEMLVDAFILANDRLRLTDTPISQLTDHIFQKILYEDFGNDENMRKAKHILERIESRNFYKFLACETFEGEEIDVIALKKELSKVHRLKAIIENISISIIKLDMTPSNDQKALKDVLVYRKTNDEKISCARFDWHKYQHCLKPKLENLRRHQLLILYTGEMEFSESLTSEVEYHLRRILMDSSLFLNMNVVHKDGVQEMHDDVWMQDGC